ncbi:MAG: hypothetical protein M1570_04455 [Chloroflexi bacterium]|nr:hypothetical protein [Chloroflexota bacterium]
MVGQPTDFWNQLGSNDADVEHLYGFLLERGTPANSRDLAVNLIEWRVHEEERRLAEIAARRAPVYQPKETYSVGQSILFTALGNREGFVRRVRDADNPRLGLFQVIGVQFDDEPNLLEFASSYAAPHPLNQEIAPTAITLDLTAEQAVETFADKVRGNLVQRLGADKEFVHLGDQWYLKGLLPEINPGYLNLAEAAVEQTGDAMTTGELLKILDLPETEKRSAMRFGLNLALSHDARFEDVGPMNETRWFLVRLEPPEAHERPGILDANQVRTVPLSSELETIADELVDKADSVGNGHQSVAPRDEVTLILTYPHRRAGTLPLTPLVRALLPDFSHPRLRFTFVDGTTEEKVAGYAVTEGNYLAGLTNWFASRRLSPGAYITLRRGPRPLTLIIEYQSQRERSLWVRVARGINGRLLFSQEKRPLSHKYDEEMLIVVADPVGLDALARAQAEQRNLQPLLDEVFPELAKLSSSGHVHAKTIFSAVNLVRRTGPRAVFSALAESRSFASVGGGYFMLNEEARR